ncbi:MAG TPA: HD-GYP domain-containing protein [Bdellovibrionota bacterium]|nr:HD-GYP domain-containing protein [Bdellovibrionota bacterium]
MGRPFKMLWDNIPDWAHAVTEMLLLALKARDPYTSGHSYRVAYQAKMLAKAAGLDSKEQEMIEFASLFHDLGKIGTPDSVLLKPGRLTREEEAIMREHPVRSHEIMSPLAHVPFFQNTLPGILHHHERIDGLGYPSGIKGEAIPLSARVILIADTYDAMTTTRPYRKGLSNEIAYSELIKFAGLQFDPQLVRIFVECHPHWEPASEDLIEKAMPFEFRKAA